MYDCVLSPSDLPKPMEYTATEETKKPRVGRYWWVVGKIVHFKGEPRFPILTSFMRIFPHQMLIRALFLTHDNEV